MTRVLAALFALLLAACASNYSAQQTLAEDSYMVYKESYKALAEAEKRYMNILFNLERLPDNDELWIMKRETEGELEQLRTLMLQSRGEFDDAVRAWDEALLEKQAEEKRLKNYKSPNLKGRDANRSSPGEMLQSEADQIHLNNNR